MDDRRDRCRNHPGGEEWATRFDERSLVGCDQEALAGPCRSHSGLGFQPSQIGLNRCRLKPGTFTDVSGGN